MRSLILLALMAAFASPGMSGTSRIPESLPWLALARDAGLGTRPDAGLAFAIWRDGTILRRVSGSAIDDEVFEQSSLSDDQLEGLQKAITESGIESRDSAQRHLDLPEDGLVIRGDGKARCWYDTPGTEETPGLAAVAAAAAALTLAHSKQVTVALEHWLPWSHHWEKACR